MTDNTTEDTEEQDPLKHADLGETATIRRSKTLHSINFTPSDYFGSDRFADHIDIVDVEVIDGDGASQDIRITWEGDVTKSLPPRWDYHAEPVTEQEHRTARRRKWGMRVASALAVVVPLGTAFWLSTVVMNKLGGKMTINGEPVTAPTPESMAITLGMVFFIAALVMYGARGGFPGRV